MLRMPDDVSAGCGFVRYNINMKALVKKEARLGLWLEDVPKPVIGINDVLIRVDRAGICGTDVHI